MTAPTQPSTYPVQLAIDYPDRSLNRLTTALRIFWAIPIVIVLECVSGGHVSHSNDGGAGPPYRRLDRPVGPVDRAVAAAGCDRGCRVHRRTAAGIDPSYP
jgi:hypothetical protein